MLLTFPRFQRLRPRAQLLHVMTAGTYLTQRWQGARVINLYYLLDAGRGYFAEISLDDARDCFTVLRSFRHSVPLEAYARYVQLPE